MKNRQNKSIKRENMSEQEKIAKQEQDRIQKASKRAKETEEERKLRQEKDRDRKREKANAIKRQTDTENEREKNRLYKQKMRMDRTIEQIEFDKLEYVLRKRKFRTEMCDAEKEKEKEKSRIGMKNLRLEGPIMDYQKREIRELDDLSLWEIFWKKGQKYKDLLIKLKPDVASIIKDRLENDVLKIPEDIISNYDEQLDSWHEDENDFNQDEETDSTENEMCAYEKVREENIKELEALKKASGLFDD